jgi:hypothetical protein
MNTETDDYGMRRRRRGMKTGERNKGRRTQMIPIADVDTQPCPDRDGTHHVINTKHGRTRCEYCRRTWADLDADLRATLPRQQEHA